ncbi:hypothetical protein CMO89_04545 [Candidatus Woesearchaeota archaeon]|nr:hypothetical protein [Candidatus Woesearchaeota archaeon]
MNILFILAVLFHFFDWRTGFSVDPGMRSIIIGCNFILLLFAFILVFNRDFSRLPGLIFIFLIASFLPLVRNGILWLLLQISPSVQVGTIDMIMAFAPAWIIYIMFNSESSRALKIFSTVYILIWLGAFAIEISSNPMYSELLSDVMEIDALKTEVIDPYAPIGRLWETIKKGWKSLREVPGKVSKATSELLERQLMLAAGDYYTGKVDQNANEQLGVYLEDIQQADPELEEGEPVTVWANLKARTLDKDKPIDISVSCWTGDEERYGRISPEDEFTVHTLEEEEIDCYFRSLDDGSHSITLSADFNFETMSYYKSYFMDKDRKRSMKREEIDIFEHFEIADEEPVAVYTVGPVKIGMEIREDLPVGIDREKGYEAFVLGVTLDNDWEGEIKEVTKLRITLPPYVKLVEDEDENEKKLGTYCHGYSFFDYVYYYVNEPDTVEDIRKKLEASDTDILEIETGEGIWTVAGDGIPTAAKVRIQPSCDKPGGECRYQLNQEEYNKKIGSVETYVSLRCPIVVYENDYKEFLGDTPLIVKYFKVTTEYDYRIEESISVDVEEAELPEITIPEEVEACAYEGTYDEEKGEEIVEVAREYNIVYEDLPYQLGGESEEEGGFDCSGLVHSVFKDVELCGFDYRLVSSQYEVVGKPVLSRGEEYDAEMLMPGDLIYFDFEDYGRPNTVDHVALYAGDNKIIHSSSINDRIEEEEMNDYYIENFYSARRYALSIEEPAELTIPTIDEIPVGLLGETSDYTEIERVSGDKIYISTSQGNYYISNLISDTNVYDENDRIIGVIILSDEKQLQFYNPIIAHITKEDGTRTKSVQVKLPLLPLLDIENWEYSVWREFSYLTYDDSQLLYSTILEGPNFLGKTSVLEELESVEQPEPDTE